MLAGKRITLIIGGGIAAYKCLDLIRRLRGAGADVTPVLTRAGTEFVTPLSVAALAGARVFQDLFDLKDESEMGHIQLSRAADLLVVAPATADMMAKMAGGHADDLATTLLLATDKPVLMAPAMNLRMWGHPATQRNLAQLRADGVAVVGPENGDMACGEHGPGRMAEPADILTAIAAALGPKPLIGKRVLVTSGPTHEPIDPVRYIANRSSGAQGTAIAAALRDLGADVVFVTGPASVAPPAGVQVVAVETAQQMLHAVEAELPVDAAIMAAAVADWRVENNFTQKIKKAPESIPILTFSENPDILKTLSSHVMRPPLVIGFAAETENVIKNATAKRARKGCDWIVANDVSAETGIMGGTENAVHLVTMDGVEDWPRLPKSEVGHRLAARIAEALT
ncbi:bifunctional phosphopantothenoylcysteine decarboxylase/phosphopantothenate--cysteine ligase CoaBC [Roseinatronobacter alkalisoli]|uniref:Coenzyme A biosynthesis bifunctional protein CoaBC n=1 Tax=Roseinatronobacter alkalisoli TaxID=3028235 RepID=A0ABT5T6H4_9RHOB|nr:bifunctional phosphopantothenoylcysteine decarboxylase/phosphopantothenate--cysteine ligase CoaBC [Roseinatronobacter sp. HJB301]MDD7970581.1 bifunctional phosphopantothenoylcysteine decarboxylase/phosphopantothenate--cysteine ligase CoaBC [Roseinatronobacter sp. HJB301]